MKFIRDCFGWMRAGTKDGQIYLWLGLGLYVLYEWLVWTLKFDAKDVQALSILTLGFLALGESSIGCASWLLSQGDRPDEADLRRWMSWARPIIGLTAHRTEVRWF